MQINETLSIQAQRMEEASREEKRRKASGIDGRKRTASAPAEQPSDAKRPKLDPETSSAPSSLTSTLAAFDFTSLPPSLITDLIIANLEAFTESALKDLVQQYRQKRGLTATASTSAGPAAGPLTTATPNIPTGPRRLVSQYGSVERDSTPPSRSTPPIVKVEEYVDPLQMDIDQDELEFEPETLNAQVGIY
jgi:symplekin